MDKIFNSYSLPIPPVRFDLQRIPLNQNGESFIYFYDSMGYATPDFALPSDAEAMLSLIDGSRSVEDILKFSTEEITKEQILGYVRFLDEHGLLDSTAFAEQVELIESEYEKSSTHYCTTSGSSYPSDSKELKIFLDEAFSTNEQSKPVESAKALYAPHIDPRVGMRSYIKAFSSIKELKPKRVIILATSHYAGLHGNLYEETPFIISDKTFTMPNGNVKSHKPLLNFNLNSFQDLEQIGISNQSRAHRIEHSIELPLLFLTHIWNHNFEIVPILVGGLDEILYSKNSFREQQLDAFSSILHQLDDDETFFLISGDLSHFGHKFGDQREADKMVDEVKINDDRFLQIGASGNSKKLISLMKEEYDPYRICGFPPLITFLKAFPHQKGKIISYDFWDEKDRKSAVSFGSILYT